MAAAAAADTLNSSNSLKLSSGIPSCLKWNWGSNSTCSVTVSIASNTPGIGLLVPGVSASIEDFRLLLGGSILAFGDELC